MAEGTRDEVGTERARAIAAFYAEEHKRLRHTVLREVSAPALAVEDACQSAWEALIRRPDIALDHRGFSWLVRVAVSRVWRESARQRHGPSIVADALIAELGNRSEEAWDPLERCLARERHEHRVKRLLALNNRERQFLALQALGLDYREISARTGSSLRTVERQLLRAKRKLRDQGG
jgi:RNA polymerase sigma factor (sigma-70 family)